MSRLAAAAFIECGCFFIVRRRDFYPDEDSMA
jgi:hypothetical protein